MVAHSVESMVAQLDKVSIQANNNSDTIPTIDLSPLLNSSEVPESLVAEVEAACRDWGFFQVINHGVPKEVLERAWAASREFFELPALEKQKVRRDELNALGYYESEHTRNVKDLKEVFDFVLKEKVALPAIPTDVQVGHAEEDIDVENRWPEKPAEFREIFLEYAKATEPLGYKLLEIIALTLNLPAKRLNRYFEKDNTHFIRLNYYPPCQTPDLVFGVGCHQDSGAITMIAQDNVGGLEIKRSNGQWMRVEPIPNSYVVNIGDVIQVWSNNKYKSVEHRVMLSTDKARFSLPFFFNPGPETNVKPIEELLDDGNSPNYKGYKFGDFFKARLNGNFQKLNMDNLQITHFKKT